MLITLPSFDKNLGKNHGNCKNTRPLHCFSHDSNFPEFSPLYDNTPQLVKKTRKIYLRHSNDISKRPI